MLQLLSCSPTALQQLLCTLAYQQTQHSRLFPSCCCEPTLLVHVAGACAAILPTNKLQAGSRRGSRFELLAYSGAAAQALFDYVCV
jgi:hypothetical protein